jgi:hypothetical protein
VGGESKGGCEGLGVCGWVFGFLDRGLEVDKALEGAGLMLVGIYIIY